MVVVGSGLVVCGRFLWFIVCVRLYDLRVLLNVFVVRAKRWARPWGYGGGENRHGLCPHRAYGLMYSAALYSWDY